MFFEVLIDLSNLNLILNNFPPKNKIDFELVSDNRIAADPEKFGKGYCTGFAKPVREYAAFTIRTNIYPPLQKIVDEIITEPINEAF